MFGKRVLLSLVGLGAGGLLLATAGTAQATVSFDPTGTGSYLANPLVNFDWSPGNSIATGSGDAGVTTVGGVEAINNFIANKADGGSRPVTFNFFYQAQLGTYQLGAGGGKHTMPSATTELTIVAGITERVTAVGTNIAPGIPASASFTMVPGLNFLEIYYDNNPATQAGNTTTGILNNLIGTGFNDGKLILSSRVISVQDTQFSLTSATPVALDQNDNGVTSPANDYPGINTVTGNGETQASAVITAFDPNFFAFSPDGPGILQLTFLNTIGLETPFKAVDPSSGFVIGPNTLGIDQPGPAPDLAIGPDNNPADNSVGSLNGFSGPDIVFQSDTSQTFGSQIVPEPVTASLSLLGLVGVGLIALRRRA